MKKIFLLLIFILISISGFSQPIPDSSIPKTNTTVNKQYNGWGRVGNTCAGCPSFFYKVLRTDTKIYSDDGNSYYYYYVSFYSNSFYPNGTYTSTYITNITFTANGVVLVHKNYVLLPPKKEVVVCWIRVPVYDAVIAFTAEKFTVF
jgi:hypothetical protein